jgi:hypothetical protein
VRRGSVRVQRDSVGCGVAQFRVRCGSVQGAAWLSSGCGMAQLGCGVAQYRVRRGSVEGCSVAQFGVRRGSVDRVQRGSVRVQRDPVQV